MKIGRSTFGSKWYISMRLRRSFLFSILAMLIFYVAHFFHGKGIDHTFSLFEAAALIIAFVTAVFITLNFSPIVLPKIIASWADENKKKLIVRLEFENVSKVVALVKNNGICFQLLKQNTDKGDVNEWVAFDKSAMHLMKPLPEEWREPEVINTTTGHVYPGEIFWTERLYNIDLKPNEILHLGIQFKLARGPLSFWHPEQWTKACIIAYPVVQNALGTA